MQLENLIDLIFTIKASAYSFEAANPRHEHEWRMLEKVKLPDGKILIPGAVTHSNVMIEHPEVVADRIERWARIVGRENLVFGNDCGPCMRRTSTVDRLPLIRVETASDAGWSPDFIHLGTPQLPTSRTT